MINRYALEQNGSIPNTEVKPGSADPPERLKRRSRSVGRVVLARGELGVGAPSARLIEDFYEHSEVKSPMSGQSL